jgi:hypothetical protein
MQGIRFSGVIALLSGGLLVGALASQALAGDQPTNKEGVKTYVAAQAPASVATRSMEAKQMTDEQMDQTTAGLDPSNPLLLIQEGIGDLRQGKLEGFRDVLTGVQNIFRPRPM